MIELLELLIRFVPIPLGILLYCISLNYAQALPLFSRQTGQNCVSCHAGGQYSGLTPYSCYFKLTAYTIGKRTAIPVSDQYVGGAATSSKSNNGTGQVQQSGKLKSNYLFLNVSGNTWAPITITFARPRGILMQNIEKNLSDVDAEAVAAYLSVLR